jgi:hypothetical protein
MKLIVTILFLGVLFLLSNLIGQQSGDNPHGDIDLDCDLCHSTESWVIVPDSMKFDHDQTGYPLIGRHADVYCRECHQQLIFSHIGVLCIDCHADIHRSEFGNACENCHSPLTWENRQEIFEQHAATRFPLLGVHAIVDCDACHYKQEPSEYKTTSLECYGCHSEDYQSAENPDHISAKFSSTCEDCHLMTAYSWSQTYYAHPPPFILRGAHLATDCNSCHQTGFAGTADRCEDCHMQDYNTAADPDHHTFGFPTDCSLCHNESNWQGHTFDHLAESGFELRGAHLLAQCTSCHVNNQVSGLPQTCFGCHEADYVSARDPNHVAGQFPEDCLECHSESAWSPATFDHNNTNFVLTGAHTSVSCTDCHSDGQYTGLSTECFSCHENEYNSTSDPNHITAGFPVQCESCHNTTRWDETTWDHDSQYFPIYSGTHQQAWTTCDECHTVPADYKAFECIFCHEHNDPSDLANKHDDEQGYQYLSSACYDCHKDGRAEDD